jgi:PAS domain-containing protein
VHRKAPYGNKVLVSAPYGNDAASVSLLLGEQNYETLTCQTLGDVAEAIDDQAGVILVTEESLRGDIDPLHRAIAAQPDWSDIPFVLLAGRSTGRGISGEWIRRRLPDNAVNVVLLERPLSAESLTSAIASAMRARQKQFEIRDKLAELADGQSRLTTLLDALPVGVAFVNPDGTTRLANPEFRRFLPTGVIPSHLADGEARWEGYDAEGKIITRDRFIMPRALRGERVEGQEFLHHPDGGAPVWTRVSGIPLLSDDEITGAISVIVNIDEQKRAQEALANAAQKLEEQVAERTAALTNALSRLQAEAEERARAEEALRQSQKMEAVGQLTGGIAHDFNNMLTGITGALDVLRRRIASGRTADLDRFMDAASTSAQRAAALTARLLAFSRRQSLDSRPTDVNSLVGSLEELLRRTMSEQIVVAIDRAKPLSAALVDANQLENAILNLAINARDAMPEGGRSRSQHATSILMQNFVRGGLDSSRAIMSACRLRTPEPEWMSKSWRRYSSRSSRQSLSVRVPGSVSRWSMVLRSSRTAMFSSIPLSAAARASPYSCRRQTARPPISKRRGRCTTAKVKPSFSSRMILRCGYLSATYSRSSAISRSKPRTHKLHYG